jgi:hypothetical protein
MRQDIIASRRPVISRSVQSNWPLPSHLAAAAAHAGAEGWHRGVVRPFVHADREIGLRIRDIDQRFATKLDEPDLAFAGKLIREAVRDISVAAPGILSPLVVNR